MEGEIKKGLYSEKQESGTDGNVKARDSRTLWNNII